MPGSIKSLRKFLRSKPARVRQSKETTSSYNPKLDTVFLLSKRHFDSEFCYYLELAHELVHWTGHYTRLGRPFFDLSNKNCIELLYYYYSEEITAELGAVWLTKEFGFCPTQESINYLVDYEKVTPRDLLGKALTDAEEAVKFLFTF